MTRYDPPTRARLRRRLDHRPDLARALAGYRYALRVVAGGEASHAGAIQARAAVHAVAPAGVDVDALASAYVEQADAADAAESARLARAERCTTTTWPCGDAITVEGDDGLIGNAHARRVRITHERVGNEGPISDVQREEAIAARRAYIASVR